MAILNRFLRLLKILEDLVDFGEFLTTPIGTTLSVCLLSYPALSLMGNDLAASVALVSAAALTGHCVVNRPKF